MSSSRKLDKIRNMPDSNYKLYKLMDFRGKNKLMWAAAREYARLVKKGFRP